MIELPKRLDPGFLLQAYASGIFPMADEYGDISWYSPDPRGVLEHDALLVSRSLRAVIRRRSFTVRVDTAFEAVMRECAVPRHHDTGAWISEEFVQTYTVLHRHGFAHSVEAWKGDRLVGGLYGVAIGAAFMGESMFTRETDASKVCLVALVERLKHRGYQLHDTQMVTPHMQRLGATLIPKSEYLRRLARATGTPCNFG
jgi:leucyl/phenylalanyl-tRNA---protein transferase